MGRRKIEIQPITHERNRSVTFLKRKNGLFKKAYELGVLCSVDVAVIIFEARPGHEVKLHEYSSSDIRNIVQRQTRHQGDTDLKIPSDFSGSASKFDDAGDADGDDDNGDEEEDLPAAKPSNRRRGQGRLTLPTSADDYSIQLPPPPPPAHHHHPESGAAALLSVANDRVSNMRDLHPPARPNKRTRNARSRSPSEDAMIPALPAMNSEWGLSQDNHAMGRYGRNIRHLQNPPPPPQQQEHHHPQQYHSMHQQQQHPGHGFQYTPLFPVSNQVSPPPAFIPLHQDFGSSRGLPAFGNRPGGSGSGPEGGSGYVDLHQRMRPSDSPGYDPAPYPPNANSMTRHPEHHHHQQALLSQPPPSPPPFHAQSPASTAAPHRREDRGPDGLFGNLLEADERSRQRAGSGTAPGGAGAGAGAAGLDWPMHDGLAPPERSGPSGPGGGGPRSSVEGPGIPNPANGSDWFDFLSRSNAINEVQASSGRRSSSSTWPKNNDNMDARHDNNNNNNNKAGDVYDGRKESAVRGGQGVGGEDVISQGQGQGEVDHDIPIPTSPEERIGEGGDAGNVNNNRKEDVSSDVDDTGV